MADMKAAFVEFIINSLQQHHLPSEMPMELIEAFEDFNKARDRLKKQLNAFDTTNIITQLLFNTHTGKRKIRESCCTQWRQHRYS